MNKSKIFKTFALMNFVGLLTLFLLYSNGSFDNYIYGESEKVITSPNGGTPTKVTQDTTVQKIDSVDRIRMSSSKSLVIKDLKFEPQYGSDTVKSHIIEEKPMMYGTKSGRVFRLKPYKAPALTPYKVDTTKIKNANQMRQKN